MHEASGLDASDQDLGMAMAHRIVYALRTQHVRGKVEDAEGRRVRGLGRLSLKKFRVHPKFHNATGSAY